MRDVKESFEQKTAGETKFQQLVAASPERKITLKKEFPKEISQDFTFPPTETDIAGETKFQQLVADSPERKITLKKNFSKKIPKDFTFPSTATDNSYQKGVTYVQALISNKQLLDKLINEDKNTQISSKEVSDSELQLFEKATISVFDMAEIYYIKNVASQNDVDGSDDEGDNSSDDDDALPDPNAPSLEEILRQQANNITDNLKQIIITLGNQSDINRIVKKLEDLAEIHKLKDNHSQAYLTKITNMTRLAKGIKFVVNGSYIATLHSELEKKYNQSGFVLETPGNNTPAKTYLTQEKVADIFEFQSFDEICKVIEQIKEINSKSPDTNTAALFLNGNHYTEKTDIFSEDENYSFVEIETLCNGEKSVSAYPLNAADQEYVNFPLPAKSPSMQNRITANISYPDNIICRSGKTGYYGLKDSKTALDILESRTEEFSNQILAKNPDASETFNALLKNTYLDIKMLGGVKQDLSLSPKHCLLPSGEYFSSSESFVETLEKEAKSQKFR